MSIDDLVRRPKLERVTFAPDGKRFAALEEYKGRMNLVVADLEKGSSQLITTYEGSDIAAYRWISNRRLVFSLTDHRAGLADRQGGGLFGVDADGREGRRLAMTLKECIDANQICRFTNFLSRIPGSEDEIIAGSNERVGDSPDLIRLNTRTGKRTLITEDNPGGVVHWVLDKDLVPRAAMSRNRKTLEMVVWLRDDAKSPWTAIGRFSEFEPHFEPLAFSPDGTLYIASNIESRDRKEIYRFDRQAMRPGERIARHPLVDLGLVEDPRDQTLSSPLLFDDKSGALVGIRIEGEKPEIAWLDETHARLQATIDRALPQGNLNLVTRLPDGKALILSRSSQDPGTYYVFDEQARTLKLLVRQRAWIDPKRMGRMQPIQYTSRDGMRIPAYLSLPPAREPKKLPLVVWVHGGPWARDDYGWNPEIQLFNTRGYAVLQPNYRGSTGFGMKHYLSSFRQLGQTMQDDITDGVRKLVADGIVDPDRVCIGGGSYGGYATMMGLVKEPALFKCGINVVGVVDLNWWLNLGYTDFNLYDASSAAVFLKKAIGDPVADAAMFEAYSPRLHARRIQAPVLIVHGVNDMRVPIRHGEAMRDALRAEGKPVEWLAFPDEGHGFAREANRKRYFEAMESFLAKHLGTR